MYYTSSSVLRHEFTLHNRHCIIDTCLFTDGVYECMVMYDDGDDMDSMQSRDYNEIMQFHADMVRKYNDRVWNGTPRLLGAPNNGQFVTEVYRA